MIGRRTMVAAIGAGLLLALSPVSASARGGGHLAAAINELKEGVHEGKQHMFSSFANHVHNAYDHAGAAAGHDPRGHIKIAREHMRAALRVAKRTHSVRRLQAGIRDAERALIHLKAAYASE